MDSYEALLAGGKKGNALVPGSLEASKISNYPHLPLEDDLHMPPEGKPQLADEELEFIDAWILAGATPDARLIDEELPEALYNWAVIYMETDHIQAEPGLNVPEEKEFVDLAQFINEVEQHATNSLSRVGPDGQHLVFSALNVRDTFNEAGVEALIGAAPHLIEIDLSYTSLRTDAVAELLRETAQLKRLNLSGTEVDQQITEALATIETLESLVLFEAQLTADSIAALSNLTQLNSLYLAGTNLSLIQLEQIHQLLPDVEVVDDHFLSKHKP